jgi:hypothetical protein
LFLQYDAFAMIDGGGSGRDKNDDNRIDIYEWLAGYKNVVDHGFVGLQGIADKAEAFEIFKKIDDNGGGQILLDEWCLFLKNCEVAMGTSMGGLLAAEQGGAAKTKASAKGKLKPVVKPLYLKFESPELPVDLPKKQTPLKKGGGLGGGKAGALKMSAGPGKSAEEQQAECKELLKSLAPFHSDAHPNAFGLAVGKTASEDLKRFISVFEPLAMDSPEGEVLREVGFLSADPNGLHIFGNSYVI